MSQKKTQWGRWIRKRALRETAQEQRSSNQASRSLPKCVEKSCPHKNLHMNVHSSVLHSRPKVEINQMSINDKWINKMWSIHTTDYYSAIKEKKYWYMAQHGWTLKMLCLVKEADHKRPHIVQFHSLGMSRLGRSIETESKLVRK